MQNIEFAQIDGQTLTLSYLLGSNIVISTFVANTTNCPIEGDGRRMFQIPGGTQTIHWIKLELGDRATPLAPTPFTEDLVSCWWYYRDFQISISGIGNIGEHTWWSNLIAPRMRLVPTVLLNVVHSSSNLINANVGANAGLVWFSATISSGTNWSYNASYILDAEL